MSSEDKAGPFFGTYHQMDSVLKCKVLPPSFYSSVIKRTQTALSWPEGSRTFSYSIKLSMKFVSNYQQFQIKFFLAKQLSMKISLLINKKMYYLLAEKISCSAQLNMKRVL